MSEKQLRSILDKAQEAYEINGDMASRFEWGGEEYWVSEGGFCLNVRRVGGGEIVCNRLLG
jgi:hypothetical protein